MQASFVLKRLSRATHTLRSSLLRTTSIFRTTASSRLSCQPLPRSFINSGAAASLAPQHSLVNEAPQARLALDSQPFTHQSPPPASPSSSSVFITLQSDGVVVCRSQHTAFVPLRWLRDHCTSPHAYDAKTNSRLSPIPLSAHDWAARDIAVDSDGAHLRITWRDGRKSTYSAGWLAATVLPKTHSSQLSPVDFLKESPILWEGQPLLSAVASMSEANLPTVSNRALALPAGILRACSHLHRFGVVFIDDLEASESATRAMIERFGVLRNSMFGAFWTFQADSAMDDLA
jgi:hypothetical protein